MVIEKAKEYIAIHNKPSTLFVLKGFSVALLEIESPLLQSTIDNKIMRLFQLSQQERAIITFDEFVCLYEIAVLQFKKIYVIENPIFQNIFPVGVTINTLISDALLAHFDDDADGETQIGTIEEYANIYSNLIKTNYGIACCYNITESQLSHEKIEIYCVELPSVPLQNSVDDMQNQKCINICKDVDYYECVQQLYLTKNILSVSFDNYIMGKESIEAKLFLLNAQFPNRISQFFNNSTDIEIVEATEVKNIMKRLWNYDEFRNVKIYNIESLARKIKKVDIISQGKIIGDLIYQTEKCIKGEDFRDIFVTAPTGAGKSLMFQLPAIYLAEKYNLVTLIVSPLIALMNDQVQALKRVNYPYAKTINGDISPIVKQEILEDVKSGNCHILYLSPESLLARSDIEQLIGSRRIGMVIIDEAHIVTTWGKQFRPDYWFLGDHVQKIFRAQCKKEADGHGFVIATFTATAIYEGTEDMYHETLNSLHMNDPITYLGYVRRENISIDVSNVEKKNKAEYELDKFEDLVSMINASLMRRKKTLIYFPTVTLIIRFYAYCQMKNIGNYVAKYHGQLTSDERAESFNEFLQGSKIIMLATKAFGMGIDISDISIVAHFAPTGNVCDYMQEIGRAARESTIDGHAIYRHMSNDFKHINRLHGLSTIRKYQLIRVIEKILEIYRYQLKQSAHGNTKKRNEMLVDAESFSYIFDSPSSNNDESDLVNKVKTAMLLIQKDYENRLGYSPFTMRPIPIFKNGYFAIDPQEQKQMNLYCANSVKPVFKPLNICEVDLDKLWTRFFKNSRDGMSFPKFKFLLYTNNKDLKINRDYKLLPAMEVQIALSVNYEQIYETFIKAFKKILNANAKAGTYLSVGNIVDAITDEMRISLFKSESIVNVLLAAIDIFQREYSGKANARIYRTRETPNNSLVTYSFNASVRDFFSWINRGYDFIKNNIIDDKIYVVNDGKRNNCKELLTVMGLLESIGVLRFRSLGGSQSQIYIYIYSTKHLLAATDKPTRYRNNLLELIEKRHADSVKMLSFLFQSDFASEEIWNHMENYFLGILPDTMI